MKITEDVTTDFSIVTKIFLSACFYCQGNGTIPYQESSIKIKDYKKHKEKPYKNELKQQQQ